MFLKTVMQYADFNLFFKHFISIGSALKISSIKKKSSSSLKLSKASLPEKVGV